MPAQFHSFRTSDPDEAREFCADLYYPISLDLIGAQDGFAFSFDVTRVGPITIGDCRFRADARVSCGDLGDWYHVSVLTEGWAESRHRARVVNATPACAAMYQPSGGIVARLGGRSRQLNLKIDRTALESELDAILGHPVRSPLRLGPSLDVSRGLGRGWAQVVGLLARELENRDGLLHQPIMAERLWRGVLTGLLFAADHQYRDALSRASVPCRPRTVKHAIDAMAADPSHPFTTVELARIAGVSMRAMQEGFQRYVGVPPMAYLRQLRLSRAREDLLQPTSSELTVAEVAHRWGFAHLGRFAAAYRARYGVSPSQTMRTRV